MDQDTAKQIAQTVYKRFGRPVGSRNYGAQSYIAREMKTRGLSWINELIDSYLLYKAQFTAYAAKAGPQPDPSLLEFWASILPYITVKMIEKETRGQRPKRKFKPKISTHAIEQLAKAEGRKV